MRFCTSDAWKCPGSSVMIFTSGIPSLPCGAADLSDAPGDDPSAGLTGAERLARVRASDKPRRNIPLRVDSEFNNVSLFHGAVGGQYGDRRVAPHLNVDLRLL